MDQQKVRRDHLANDGPRCASCGDVVGVSETLVMVLADQSTRASSFEVEETLPQDGLAFHLGFYEREMAPRTAERDRRSSYCRRFEMITRVLVAASLCEPRRDAVARLRATMQTGSIAIQRHPGYARTRSLSYSCSTQPFRREQEGAGGDRVEPVPAPGRRARSRRSHRYRDC